MREPYREREKIVVVEEPVREPVRERVVREVWEERPNWERPREREVVKEVWEEWPKPVREKEVVRDYVYEDEGYRSNRSSGFNQADADWRMSAEGW